MLKALCFVILQWFLMTSAQDVDLKIVNRIPDLCITTKGELCVFPFIYKGVRYEKCSYADSATPWCSTLNNADGHVITNKWGDCKIDRDTSCEIQQTEPQDTPKCITVGGPSSNQQCIFPFRHDGVTYNECTTAGLGEPWCSVATYANGTHISGQGLYGLCPTTCPGGGAGTCRPGATWQRDCNTCTCSILSTPVCTEKECGYDNKCIVEEGPARGESCEFPFKWGGKTYFECADWTYGGGHTGKKWCSTKTDTYNQHVNGQGNFGFCSSNCNVGRDNINIRSKFVQADTNNDDAINLPDYDNDAVVFNNDDDEGVEMPPN